MHPEETSVVSGLTLDTRAPPAPSQPALTRHIDPKSLSDRPDFHVYGRGNTGIEGGHGFGYGTHLRSHNVSGGGGGDGEERRVF